MLNKTKKVAFMMKFSKKVEYAMIAMVEMAQRQPYDDLITARSLAREYHIPPEILSKVLQKLTRSGLLQSVQGVKGGYTLARKVDQISVLDIVKSIDGPIQLVACNSGRPCDCEQFLVCNIQTPMHYIQDEFLQLLNNITLKDLLTRMRGDFSWVYRQQPDYDGKSFKKAQYYKANFNVLK